MNQRRAAQSRASPATDLSRDHHPEAQSCQCRIMSRCCISNETDVDTEGAHRLHDSDLNGSER